MDGANAKFNGQGLSTRAMTAYALIFFTDLLSNGNTFVDNNLILQLQNFLLSRRNGKGNFININGTEIINPTIDAICIHALAYSGSTVLLTTEINTLKAYVDDQIKNSKVDSYIASLLAQALYKLKRPVEAVTYADAVTKVQNLDGSIRSDSPTATTLTNSNGFDLTVQQTAQAIIAWNNNVAKYTSQITNATGYLFSKISNGYLGSSQASTIALRALVPYFSQFASVNGNGSFVVSVNNQVYQ